MINMSNIMKIRFSLDNTLNTALGVFEVKNGTRYILINPKSKQNALAVMLHEMVHAMSGTKEYTDFKKSILQYHKNEYDIIKKDIVLDKVNTEYEKIEGRTMSEELIDEESLAYYVQYKLYELARDKITEKYSKNISPKGFYQKLRSYIGKMRDKLVEMKDPYAKEVNALYKSFSNMTGAKVITTADTYKESILYTTDNKKVYKVDNDVFKVLNNYKNKDIIAKYLKDNKVVIGNSEIYITRRTRNEYLYSRDSKNYYANIFKDKIRLVDNIEELLTASDNYVNDSLKHERKDNFVEFARGNVLLDVFGKKYKADVVVGKTKKNELELYDIVKIKRADFEYKKGSESVITNLIVAGTESLPSNNLSHKENNVNNKNAKYSMDISFEDGVNDILRREIKGEKQQRDAVMVLKDTPQLLQKVGLPNLPMLMTAKHIITGALGTSRYTDANHHNLGKAILEIPHIIENPSIILKSSTRDDSIVIFGDKFDKQNRLLMVAVKGNGENIYNNVRISTNPILSFYGREKFVNFIDKNVQAGNLIYYNKKLVEALKVQGYNCQEALKFYQTDVILQKLNNDVKYSMDIPGAENVLTEMPGREESLSFFKKPTSEKKKVLADNFTKWWDKFNTSMINAQHVIEKYANKSLQILTNSKRHYKLDGADARARAESVRGLMQAARTADQAAQYMISTAQFDLNGNLMGDGLAKIFEFTRDANGSYNQKYKDFQLYLLHQHNIDRLKQNKPIFSDNITEKVSRGTIEALEKANPEFKDKAEAVWAYNQNLRELLRLIEV